MTIPTIERLLVPGDGYPFALHVSAGLEERGRHIADRCAGAYRFLSDAFATSPETALHVLSKEDWPPGSPVYGLPYYAEGRLIVAGERADFWLAFVPLLRAAPPELLARATQVYGEQLELTPFFDLLAVHELGHAFHGEGRLPRRWLEELFANLCLHSWVATVDAEQLPTLEAFPQAIAALDPSRFEHRSLEDFETIYSEMDPVNYGWYQCRFHVAAKRAHDAGGTAVLTRLWRRFVFPDGRLAETLENEVHPEVANVLTTWPTANAGLGGGGRRHGR